MALTTSPTRQLTPRTSQSEDHCFTWRDTGDTRGVTHILPQLSRTTSTRCWRKLKKKAKQNWQNKTILSVFFKRRKEHAGRNFTPLKEWSLNHMISAFVLMNT